MAESRFNCLEASKSFLKRTTTGEPLSKKGDDESGEKSLYRGTLLYNLMTERECDSVVNVLLGSSKDWRSLAQDELIEDEHIGKVLWRRVSQFVPRSIGDYTVKGFSGRWHSYSHTHERIEDKRDNNVGNDDDDGVRALIDFTLYVHVDDELDGGNRQVYVDNELVRTIWPAPGTAVLYSSEHGVTFKDEPIVNGRLQVFTTQVLFSKN
jgi:hypothetical protein